MKNIEKIASEILKRAKVIEVEMWSLNNNRPQKIYTVTDGRGDYALTNDDSVFFTEKEHDANNLAIDGKPNSKSKSLYIFKVSGKFGIYNDNFKMVHGPYREISEVEEIINEKNLKIESI